MPQLLRNFEEMWDTYPCPGGTAEDARKMIGGEVDAAWITNTCVVRVSRSLNYSGNLVPDTTGDDLLTVRGGDARNYALRVAEFKRYLERRCGPPTLTWSYLPTVGGPPPATFAGRRGVICFDVSQWSDATGHFDLWDGKACRHHGYFDQADAVHLWEVPLTVEVSILVGSVGSKGRNLRDDVRAVQDRLARHGIDPGPVDGDCGRRTIKAIKAFQAGFMRKPDGRVDPGGRTWQELLGL